MPPVRRVAVTVTADRPGCLNVTVGFDPSADFHVYTGGVGCGSGILAIAALKLGAAAALGVDTDPIAIEATLANARRNRLGHPG